MIPQTINDPGKSEAEGQSNWYHSLFRTISSMTNLVIIILIGIILYFLLLIEQGYLISVLQVFIILLAGLLPLIIYSYFQRRRNILFDQYKQNLRRLGFPANVSLYEERFNAVYGDVTLQDRAQLLQSPVVVATLLTVVGWILVFYPTDGNSFFQPNASPMAYGFLGAFLFGLGSLVRQYVTDDLQPRYYASLINRYLAVFILSWIISLLVPAVEEAGVENSVDRYLLATFFIGLFPTIGLRVVQRLGTAILSVSNKGFMETQPLSKLEGLNAYHEDRLLLEGAESLQNLACSDLVDLMLKTRYPVEQLVDWVDQALLHLHVGEQINHFKASGLRTATDFLDAYSPQGLTEEALVSKRIDLARLLNNWNQWGLNNSGNGEAADTSSGSPHPLSPEDTLILLNTMAEALRSDPNVYHIRHWRDNEYESLPEDVERDRIIADLRLMQGLEDEAISIYSELIRQHPKTASLRLYRGLAYFSLKEYHRAIEDYRVALMLGGDKWENARDVYVEMGRAWRELQDYDEAAKIYQGAIDKFDGLPEARLALALVQMTYQDRYDDAIENLTVCIHHKYKEAEARATLGLVLYQQWAARQDPEDDTALHQAKDALVRAQQLKPDLIVAYLNHAVVLSQLGEIVESIHVYTVALQRVNPLKDADIAYRIRLQRGNLYLQLENFHAAIDDYQAAAFLVPNDAAAFANMGIAYKQVERFELALDAYRKVISLNPRHIVGNINRGAIAYELGLNLEAELAFSSALELVREDEDHKTEADIHLRLGTLYGEWDGHEQDAERELMRAVYLAPAEENLYATAVFTLGSHYLKTNQLDLAAKQLELSAVLLDVSELKEDACRAYLLLGRTNRLLDDKEASKNALEQAQSLLDAIFIPVNDKHVVLRSEIDDELSQVNSIN